MRLLGGDELININTAHPEFSDWKWEDVNKIEDSIVPFKQELYREIVTEFKAHI
jgi:putative (di)nucleoside polyphosphate hydrolase